MLQRIKNWLGITEIENKILGLEIDSIDSTREELDETRFIREKLGSIALDDVRGIIKTEQEIKDYQAAISSVFKNHIEPTLKRLLINQEKFMGEQVQTMEQLSFGRGTVNGLLLVIEEFQHAWEAHQENTKGKEPVNPRELFPTTPSLEDILSNQRST